MRDGLLVLINGECIKILKTYGLLQNALLLPLNNLYAL